MSSKCVVTVIDGSGILRFGSSDADEKRVQYFINKLQCRVSWEKLFTDFFWKN